MIFKICLLTIKQISNFICNTCEGIEQFPGSYTNTYVIRWTCHVVSIETKRTRAYHAPACASPVHAMAIWSFGACKTHAIYVKSWPWVPAWLSTIGTYMTLAMTRPYTTPHGWTPTYGSTTGRIQQYPSFSAVPLAVFNSTLRIQQHLSNHMVNRETNDTTNSTLVNCWRGIWHFIKRPNSSVSGLALLSHSFLQSTVNNRFGGH